MHISRLMTLIVLFVIGLNVFSQEGKERKVILTGTIENSSWQRNYVEIAINRPGIRQKIRKYKIDKEGHFKATFNLNHPTDLWFDYRTNFLLAVHPGDSINIVLDGKCRKRPKMLKTIRFSGSAAKLNTQISKFQKSYYQSELYSFQSKKTQKLYRKKVKEFSAEEYQKYLTKEKHKIYDDFYSDNNDILPEAKLWNMVFLETSVLQKYTKYPSYHRRYNNIEEEVVEIDYYDRCLDLLPITDSMLICGDGLNKLTNIYRFNYAREHTLHDIIGKDIQYHGRSRKELEDSLFIHGIIKHTKDDYLRQTILTERIRFDLEHAFVDTYEKYNNLIEKYVTNEELLNYLAWRYNKLKTSLENPDFTSNTLIKAAKNSSINQIIDSVMMNNKGKVVYIDCWATWCGPCLSEMPNSVELHKKFKDKDVSFVYFCIDSDEKKGKALVDKFDLQGEHYFLNKEQSNNLREIFEISGIPHYIVINREGEIQNKRYNLRPLQAQKSIEKLLEE